MQPSSTESPKLSQNDSLTETLNPDQNPKRADIQDVDLTRYSLILLGKSIRSKPAEILYTKPRVIIGKISVWIISLGD